MGFHARGLGAALDLVFEADFAGVLGFEHDGGFAVGAVAEHGTGDERAGEGKRGVGESDHEQKKVAHGSIMDARRGGLAKLILRPGGRSPKCYTSKKNQIYNYVSECSRNWYEPIP